MDFLIDCSKTSLMKEVRCCFIFFLIVCFIFGCAGSSLLRMGFLWLWRMGLVALRYVASSWSMDWTHVPCICRQILVLCTIREAQRIALYFGISSLFLCKPILWKTLLLSILEILPLLVLLFLVDLHFGMRYVTIRNDISFALTHLFWTGVVMKIFLKPPHSTCRNS